MPDLTTEQTEWVSPRVKLTDLIIEFCNTYAYTTDEAIKAMRQGLQEKKGMTYPQLKEASERTAWLRGDQYR